MCLSLIHIFPDLTLPTEPELPLGRYALMHRDYLEKHKRVTYLLSLIHISFQPIRKRRLGLPCSMGIRATEIICREVMMKNGLPLSLIHI